MRPEPRMSPSMAMLRSLAYFMPRARSPRQRDSINPDVQAHRIAAAKAKRARRRERNLRERAFLRPRP